MGNCFCPTHYPPVEMEPSPRPKVKVNPNLSYKYIVKIQACYRGYLARKKYFSIRVVFYNARVLEHLRHIASVHLYAKFKKLQPITYTEEETDIKDPLFSKRIFKMTPKRIGDGHYIGEW